MVGQCYLAVKILKEDEGSIAGFRCGMRVLGIPVVLENLFTEIINIFCRVLSLFFLLGVGGRRLFSSLALAPRWNFDFRKPPNLCLGNPNKTVFNMRPTGLFLAWLEVPDLQRWQVVIRSLSAVVDVSLEATVVSRWQFELPQANVPSCEVKQGLWEKLEGKISATGFMWKSPPASLVLVVLSRLLRPLRKPLM